MRNINDPNKLGQWPLLSSRDVTLEFVEEYKIEDDSEKPGYFDGPMRMSLV